MMLLCSIALLLYIIMIGALLWGLSKVETFIFDSLMVEEKTRFSIVVPFRNEGKNLPNLLHSFENLNYPRTLFEIILVDDASEDDYAVPNSSLTIRVVPNIRKSNSPKKDAILTAINLAQHEWIVTTDADCEVPQNWLKTFDAFIQEKNCEMIAGGVNYRCDATFLHHFQQLDLASLQGATIGSFGLQKGFMCNGANFAYTKSLFMKLGGFENNNHLASGDDVFLLQKAIAYNPKVVRYLKSESAIVNTRPLNSWKELFYQRVRWASKAMAYQSLFAKILGLVVFGANLFWVLSFVPKFRDWVLEDLDFFLFFTFTVLKFAIDFLLIQKANSFLGNKMRYFFASSLLYPFFSVTVALYSVFGKYEWKGRTFGK